MVAQSRQVNPSKFYKRTENRDNFIILDVRSKEVARDWPLDFEGIETINYPYFNLLDEIPESLKNKLSKDKEIIVVCSKGESSKVIADSLQEQGYKTKTLNKGTKGWSKVYTRKEIPTESENSKVFQYVRPSSGCLAYMVVSGTEAIVIDPLKQFTDTYIEHAEQQNANIVKVIDTHIHADHISGIKELSEKTDSEMIMFKNAKERGVKYDINTVEDRDKLYFGSDSIEVIHTPGHTTDMASYKFNNILFTGDSLFTNGIARPDLEDKDGMEGMAESLYNTITETIRSISDENTIISPAHKFSNETTDKLNNTYTREFHHVMSEIDETEYSRDEFISNILQDMPPRPANYGDIIDINKGIKEASEEEESELELGPNNCSAS